MCVCVSRSGEGSDEGDSDAERHKKSKSKFSSSRFDKFNQVAVLGDGYMICSLPDSSALS